VHAECQRTRAGIRTYRSVYFLNHVRAASAFSFTQWTEAPRQCRTRNGGLWRRWIVANVAGAAASVSASLAAGHEASRFLAEVALMGTLTLVVPPLYAVEALGSVVSNLWFQVVCSC
jgi:hypothetical protein